MHFFPLTTVQEPLYLLFYDLLTMNKHTYVWMCMHTHIHTHTTSQSTQREFSGNLENRRSLSLAPVFCGPDPLLLTSQQPLPLLRSNSHSENFLLAKQRNNWVNCTYLSHGYVMCILKKKLDSTHTHTPFSP